MTAPFSNQADYDEMSNEERSQVRKNNLNGMHEEEAWAGSWGKNVGKLMT